MAQEREHDEQKPGSTPDEVEQRQRADGTYEEPTSADDTDEPLSPDMLEQRRRYDGTFDEPDEVPDEPPLSPDMIEQRQVVEYDDEDEPDR
jgi:hypothetical protein